MRSLKRDVRAMNRCGTRKHRHRSRANCIPPRTSALARQCRTLPHMKFAQPVCLLCEAADGADLLYIGELGRQQNSSICFSL